MAFGLDIRATSVNNQKGKAIWSTHADIGR